MQIFSDSVCFFLKSGSRFSEDVSIENLK